jgi:phosphoserine aminotransferase
LVNPNKFRFADQDGVICITQNETSNGTQVSNKVIWQIRENNPNHLIAIDTTSSMAGVALNFESADLWLASVQKCFGLPAGLGLLICSPRAVERAKAMNKNSYYNSFVFMHEMMQKWQTSYTPNVLGVYLLMRVMEDADYIDDIQAKTIKRYFDWIEFFGETKGMNHLIKNEEAHSFTVIPVATNSEASIKKIKSEAKGEGLLLGEGYGELKATTFRIANFPAIKKSEIKKLQQFLKSFDR